MNFTSLPPLSLYVHMPWCVRKCPYCDFNSHVAPDHLPEIDYVDALLRDLQTELPAIWGRKIETIFFGGGTPSLFSVAAMDRLLSGIRALVPVNPNAEITLEANPGTAEAEKFIGFREIGFNRISIGVQSFDSGLLKAIGRIHDGEQAMRAFEFAQRGGFQNINLDLMFGLPTQTLTQAMSDIDIAIGLNPTHLSYYQLTLEPNTLFHSKPPIVPDHDECWEIQESGKQKLAASGFGQYEVSAYARDGFRCRHNVNYWQFGDYVGIGAGAHGKITRSDTQTIERVWKLKSPRDFMAGIRDGTHIGERKIVTSDDVTFEYMLNALRLSDGFPISLFERRTGLSRIRIDQQLATAQQMGFIEIENDHIRPTKKGADFLNDVINLFL